MRHGRLLLCLPLLALSACVTPTTENPNVSQMELQQEQVAQAAAAKRAPINFDANKAYSATEVEQLAARLAPVAVRVRSSAVQLCSEIRNPRDCDFKIILDPSEKGLNAHADGQNIVINPAMVEFAKSDTHLAFVLAHESAHHFMNHVGAQQKNSMVGLLLGTVADAAAASQGYNTQGALGKVGQSQSILRYSSSFEAEADYVGLYVLARAGYPIEDAPNFWRMMSQAQPDAIYVAQTHPTNPSRSIAMEKTVAEIRNKERLHQPLVPNIMQKRT